MKKIPFALFTLIAFNSISQTDHGYVVKKKDNTDSIGVIEFSEDGMPTGSSFEFQRNQWLKLPFTRVYFNGMTSRNDGAISGKIAWLDGNEIKFSAAGSLPSPITYYNSTGTVSAPTKEMSFIATPNTGNGYSIDISAAGFSSIYSYSVTPVESTSSAAGVANVAVKSVSTSAIVVNIIEGATLSEFGETSQFANVAGLTLMVTVKGY